MYNPNNLELPEIDDPRLTEYLYTSEFDVVQVIAFRSDAYGDELPEAWSDIEGAEGATDFHWFSADGSDSVPGEYFHGPLEGKSEVFDVEQLNPLDTDFDKVKSGVLALLGSSESVVDSQVEDWYQEASEGEFDKVRIFRERYTWEWIIRAWEGLTLDDFDTDPGRWPGPTCWVDYMSEDESDHLPDRHATLDTRLIDTLGCGVGSKRLQVRTEIESHENPVSKPNQGLWGAIRGLFRKGK